MLASYRLSALILLLGAVLQVLGCAFTGQPARTRSDTNVGRYAAGGHSLWIDCRGVGEATVVLDGGAGTWSTHYLPVQRALTDRTRTCLYDRAGLGQSDTGPLPRSSSRMADELHRLLASSGESPPFVLVGHSLGGYNVRLYQHRFPSEVAALVLIDAAHPRQWEALPSSLKDLVVGAPSMLRQMATMAKAGEITADAAAAQVSGAFPADVRERLIRAGLTSKSYEGRAAEFEAAILSGSQVPESDLGSLPLVVLSARRSAYAYEGMGVPIAEANAAWLALQSELTGLSRRSTQLFSEGTHALHETHAAEIADAVLVALRMLGINDP